jgi:dihydropteroate synthase
MQLMAVVNVTPDSFYDGGIHASTDAAVAYAMRCIEDGADILDIGGESSRPGSESVTQDDELRRVIPVIEGIRRHSATIPISIDTTKSQVVREAARYGIHYANDITALRGDPEMAATVATLQLKIILMHMQGSPKTMQAAPAYNDIVADVRNFLQEQVAVATLAGIPMEKIFLDPGIGFGKTVDHNIALLQHLNDLNTLGYPLIVGTSRKSFIAKLAEVETPGDRLPGSLATLPAMLQANVAIVRTHDVAATRQFLRVFQAL